MPTAPTLRGPSVQQRGLGNVRVSTQAPSAETFGGGSVAGDIAEASQGVLNTGQKIYEVEKAKADYYVQQENKQLLDSWDIKNRFDSKTGAVSKRGKNAFDIPETLNDSFDKMVQERAAALSDDEQRAAFIEMANARKSEINKWAQSHVARERDVYEQTTYAATLESSKEIAVTSPDALQRELVSVKQQVYNQGKLKGWSEEVIRQEMQKHTTDLHSRMIGKLMADGQDLNAKAYFDKVKKEIDPDMKTQLTAQLRESSIRGESQRQADKIYFSHADSMTNALDKARSINDPQIRDETVRRVKQRFADQRAAVAETQRLNYQDATNKLQLSFTDENAKTKGIAAIPEKQWLALSPSQQSNLRTLEKNILKGQEPITDELVYNDLQIMAANPNTRRQFMNKNLEDYINKLDKKDYRAMVKLQQQLIAGDQTAVDKLQQVSNIDAFAKQQLEATGLSLKDKKRTASFLYQVRKEATEIAALKGNPLNMQELKDITDGLLIRGDSNGDAWDIFASDKYYFQVKDQQDAQFVPFSGQNRTLPNPLISEAERAKIQKALANQGEPVIEQNVESVWRVMQDKKGNVGARSK